jgi:hypothetical protein
VDKASTYRENAKECRKHAARTTDRESRDNLLRMADNWERLAADLQNESKEPELPPPRKFFDDDCR